MWVSIFAFVTNLPAAASSRVASRYTYGLKAVRLELRLDLYASSYAVYWRGSECEDGESAYTASSCVALLIGSASGGRGVS